MVYLNMYKSPCLYTAVMMSLLVMKMSGLVMLWLLKCRLMFVLQQGIKRGCTYTHTYRVCVCSPSRSVGGKTLVFVSHQTPVKKKKKPDLTVSTLLIRNTHTPTQLKGCVCVYVLQAHWMWPNQFQGEAPQLAPPPAERRTTTEQQQHHRATATTTKTSSTVRCDTCWEFSLNLISVGLDERMFTPHPRKLLTRTGQREQISISPASWLTSSFPHS